SSVAAKYKTFEDIMKASSEELQEIDGIGEVVAESIFKFFRNEGNVDVIERLKLAGLGVVAIDDALSVEPSLAGTLEGKTFVVTGTLEKYKREEAESLLMALGAKVTSSVSKNTTALIAGAKPGASKISGADKLGIPIVDEAGFEAIITTGNLDF
ncbi:MAG: NAD-dependent DNA ligase LigA, partial [Acidimicrobiales bacterium]|nr:NAD-dependent DNA ligase LigA [Acidimicrobiales bacterium]